MKRRFRTYERQGWEVVEVPRVQDDDYMQQSWHWTPSNSDKNKKHYSEILEWCNKRMKSDDFVSTLHSIHGTNKPGVKRFAFKNPKDIVFFKLKWT